MLDINLLRNNIEEVTKNVAGKKFIIDIPYFNQLEGQRKELQIEMEELQAKRNSISKQIGILKSKSQDASHLLSEVADLGEEIDQFKSTLNVVQARIQGMLHRIPNLLDESVPFGKDENENVEIRRVFKPRHFPFPVKDHVDLGNDLDKGLDFESASKIAGSRFVILKHNIAKLHRALAHFMLETHIQEHGYTEIYVPYLVKASAVFGTAQLPKFEEDLFKISGGDNKDNDRYLISTAEISLTNMVADTILKHSELPLKFVAHSPCFRSEAGSYGRDTRGMIRTHQFDKVEMVQIVHPENSAEALEQMVLHGENILRKLELPYRVVLLCSGDTAFGSSKTYDLEVWLPSQNMYREISSCSNMRDYQARRMQARVRNENNQLDLVHTLNGSGLAVGRTLVAVLENYQNEDGSITVPKVLQKYMNCDVIR